MPSSSQRVCFDAFEADLRSGELRKHGIAIKLHPQPFQVLTMLLESPGEVVTREDLRSKLWPSNTYVDFDVGLNSAVKKLRDALGDSAEAPRYVETLPRRGYRFIGSLSQATVSQAKASSALPESLGQENSTAAAAPAAVVPTASVAHTRRQRWIGAASLAGLLILLVWLYAGGLKKQLLTKPTPIRINSVAVLPLENLSGDPGQDYFADGITDALITDLAQISSLKVISRTSVIRYKGTRKPLPEIARELGVDGIVEGAVIRSGERVRVDAQLIEGSSDRHFWARSYERSLNDVIGLQNEIARAIAAEIQVQLTPQEQARLSRSEPVDPLAYELYLRGHYFWSKRTEASLRKSIDYFQQAIQKDPRYALAYAGIAEAYVVRFDLSPQERSSKAKAAAQTALQMNEGLAPAHSALAMTLWGYDWDWAGAEREFRCALALNPNSAQAHQWYGQFLRAMGRKELATAEIKRAHELDPIAMGGGIGQYGARYELVIENARNRLEMDPNFAPAHLAVGRAYRQLGKYQDAIAELQMGVNLSADDPAYLSQLGYTYGVWGKRDEALKTLPRLRMVSRRRYVSPYDIALVYVGLGEKDLAFDWLQKAVVDRSIPLVELKTRDFGELDNLSSDPRYTELLSRIGLPNESLDRRSRVAPSLRRETSAASACSECRHR